MLKRQLILTNLPRFIYIDVKKMSIKGTIPWTNDIYGEIKSKQEFYIRNAANGRSYYICGLTSGAIAWVNQMKRVKHLYASKGPLFTLPTSSQ